MHAVLYGIRHIHVHVGKRVVPMHLCLHTVITLCCQRLLNEEYKLNITFLLRHETLL